MKALVIQPSRFPCTLAECPPGFFVFGEELCFKSEYKTNHENVFVCDAYCSSGEYFWGGTKDYEDRENLMVIPCEANWIDM